jgi:uncharacterized protein YcfL
MKILIYIILAITLLASCNHKTELSHADRVQSLLNEIDSLKELVGTDSIHYNRIVIAEEDRTYLYNAQAVELANLNKLRVALIIATRK